MNGRTEPYRIRTQDGIIVRGIPPGMDPNDPQVVEAVQRAREEGNKEVMFPILTGPDIGTGISEGARRVGLNLAEMVGLVKPETVQSFEREMAETPESFGRDVGRLGTEILGTAGVGGPVVGAARKGLSMIPRMPSVAPTVGLGVRGAGEGAIEGAILAGPEERGAGARTGALVGGATGTAMGVLGSGFRTPDEAAQRLLDMGVDLTPGQMKPQGMANLIEQTLLDVPVAGSWVGAGRRQAQEGFAAAMVNQARPPGAQPVPKGEFHQMVDRVYDQFKPAYEVAKGYPVYQGWDRSLADQFARITETPGILAKDSQRRMTKNFLDAQLSRTRRKAAKNNQGLVDSGDLLAIRSDIRTKARELRLAGKQAPVVEMLDFAEEALTRELALQLPPDILVPYLRDVDRQFAKYSIIEEAAAATKRAGPPTPFQWASAVDKKSTKRQRAHQQGFFMPETRAAMEVFETTAPRTGARNITMGTIGLGGGYGAVSEPLIGGTLAGLITAGAGTRTGRLMSSGVHPMQQRVSQLQNLMPPTAVSTLGTIARASPVVYGQQPEY